MNDHAKNASAARIMQTARFCGPPRPLSAATHQLVLLDNCLLSSRFRAVLSAFFGKIRKLWILRVLLGIRSSKRRVLVRIEN